MQLAKVWKSPSLNLILQSDTGSPTNQAVDELKLSNLIGHVSSIIANADCQISTYRKALFDKELNVKFWKTSEKEFWEECLKDFNNLKMKNDEVLKKLSNHWEDVR